MPPRVSCRMVRQLHRGYAGHAVAERKASGWAAMALEIGVHYWAMLSGLLRTMRDLSRMKIKASLSGDERIFGFGQKATKRPEG